MKELIGFTPASPKHNKEIQTSLCSSVSPPVSLSSKKTQMRRPLQQGLKVEGQKGGEESCFVISAFQIYTTYSVSLYIS